MRGLNSALFVSAPSTGTASLRVPATLSAAARTRLRKQAEHEAQTTNKVGELVAERERIVVKRLDEFWAA